MSLNRFQGLTKIKNFLDKKMLEVEAEISNSTGLHKKEKLILKRYVVDILRTRTSNNLKLLDKLEVEFLKDFNDLTESLIDTFRLDPDEFDLD